MRNRLILAILAVAVICAVAWRYYPSTSSQPSSGPPLVDVTVPELDAAAQAGETAFNDNCAVCHGVNAAGQDGVAPPLVHIIYEPNHHGDQAFYRAATQGVPAHHWPFGDMPPVEDITEQEIASIVAYVRTLQRANGIL